MERTPTASRSIRTELEQRIRDRDFTLMDFVTHVEKLAVESGELGTISYRHLQRLISGSVQPSSISRSIKRTLESTLGAPISTLLGPPTCDTDSTVSAPLTVAVSVVTREEEVLVVARRRPSPGTTTRWQFPAGIVKPGDEPEVVAVDETYLETGIYSSCTEQLGERIHHRTGVMCNYFACDYLWGQVDNLDPSENLAADWISRSDLVALIPSSEIFAGVLDHLRL